MKSVLVTGAGGFIGGHLVARLRDMGIENIRGVDRVPLDQWYQRFDDVDNRKADLQQLSSCQEACEGVDTVYNLAADMGGMGFIENNKALCMLSVLISTHMLEAARHAGVQRLFYSSSACVYAAGKQESPEVEPATRGRRLPRHARGRVRLGEAVQRAHVPALPRGLRPRDPGRPVPQRLRTARNLRRRP